MNLGVLRTWCSSGYMRQTVGHYSSDVQNNRLFTDTAYTQKMIFLMLFTLFKPFILIQHHVIASC